MAGHRSPDGRRARRQAGRNGTPAHSATTRANALAGAAAIGAVATGTLTALLPVVDAPATAEANQPVEAALTAVAIPLEEEAAVPTATGFFLPVHAITAEYSDTASTDGELALLDKAAGIAADIAALHAKQERQQAEQAKLDTLISEGGVDGWIAEALDIMDLPQSLAPGIKKIIMKESNGDPKAINRWDANAKRGTPSQGLMQTIPSTFRTFVHPSLSHLPITHPVANITAGVRYMIATYGMDTVEQGGRRTSSGSYQGY